MTLKTEESFDVEKQKKALKLKNREEYFKIEKGKKGESEIDAVEMHVRTEERESVQDGQKQDVMNN